MEESLESHNSLSATAFWVRVVVRRLLLLWYRFLHYRAGTWYHRMLSREPTKLSGRQDFLKENIKLQEELRRIFNPYYYLCNSGCCCHRQYPYSFLDGVLYGTPLDLPPGSSPMGPTKLPRMVLGEDVDLVRRYFRRYFFGKTDYPAKDQELQPQETFCPAWTEKGCNLPWGRRPVFCIFFLCGHFIRVMDWRSYWRYVWTGSRYLLLLTRSLKLVVAEWRHKQGKPALLTNRLLAAGFFYGPRKTFQD